MYVAPASPPAPPLPPIPPEAVVPPEVLEPPALAIPPEPACPPVWLAPPLPPFVSVSKFLQPHGAAANPHSAMPRRYLGARGQILPFMNLPWYEGSLGT